MTITDTPTVSRSTDVDRADRIQTRDRLVAIRQAAGMSQTDLGIRIEAAPSFVSRFEHVPDPKGFLATWARIASALGHHLWLDPIDVAGWRDTPCVWDEVNRDEFQHLATFERLVAARTRLGWSQARLAQRIGVVYSAVAQQEALDRDSYSLGVWQRYTRALGGRLGLLLVPFDDQDGAS